MARPVSTPEPETVLERLMKDLDYQIHAWRVPGIEESERWPEGAMDEDSKHLREGCRYDLERFTRTFFPEMCTAPFNPMHLDFFARANQIAREGLRGTRDVTAAPRGAAKTSTKGKVQLIWEGLYGYEQYILICAATRDMGRDKTRDIRSEFENNTELIRIYGPQETSRQNTWRQADFTLRCGCIYRAFTPRTAIRGILRHYKRPTKIVPDDAEDRETVLTPLRRQRFLDWWNADVMKLGDAQTNIDAIGTVLHPDSLLARLLQNPGYRSRKYQSVLQFSQSPSSWEHWRTWKDLVLDLRNPTRLETAKHYFTTHEAEMLDGVEVLWPARKSYYDLMLSRLTESETAFWTEEQNEPTLDESYLFHLDEIATCTLVPEGVEYAGRLIRYAEMTTFVAFYDPTPGLRKETVDWAACPVLCEDQQGYQYCVDAYCSQLDGQDDQLSAIVDLCCRWQVAKLGIESNGYQANLLDALQQKFALRQQEDHTDYLPMMVPVIHSGARSNKMLRIRTLQAPLHNHWLILNAALHAQVWTQLADFTALTTENQDDVPDSISAARAMLLKGG